MAVEKTMIQTELSNVGILIDDIYDLVNTNKHYPTAIPVLIKFLEDGITDLNIKEGVIRSLAVKEAIGIANPVLIAEYKKLSKDLELLRWAIGNTIYMTISEDCINEIIPIVYDKTNGMSRQMFVAALGKLKSKQSEDVLIDLLDDEDVVSHALDALGKLKSQKAKGKILQLTKHEIALVRKQAQKALKKIV